MITRPAFVGLALLAAATTPASAAPAVRSPGTANEQPASRAPDDKPGCPWPTVVARCTRIATPDKRLDCFDELTGHGD